MVILNSIEFLNRFTAGEVTLEDRGSQFTTNVWDKDEKISHQVFQKKDFYISLDYGKTWNKWSGGFSKITIQSVISVDSILVKQAESCLISDLGQNENCFYDSKFYVKTTRKMTGKFDNDQGLTTLIHDFMFSLPVNTTVRRTGKSIEWLDFHQENSSHKLKEYNYNESN